MNDKTVNSLSKVNKVRWPSKVGRGRPRGTGGIIPDRTGSSSGRQDVKVPNVRTVTIADVEAAKTRVAIDRSLQIRTPEWIVRLSKVPTSKRPTEPLKRFQ